MSKIMLFALFGAAIVLVTVFAAAAFFTTNVHEMSPAIPAANAVQGSVELAPVPAHAVAARSLYVSEKTLQARLDEAYERGPKSQWQALQVPALRRILNGRYERRSGGFPY